MCYRHIGKMWLLAVSVLLLCEAATAQRNALSPPAGLSIEIMEPEPDANNNWTDYGARLTWEANHRSENVESYNLYVKRLGDACVAGTFELFLSTTETEVVLTSQDLDIASSGFVYYVTAVNGDGESDASNMVSSACGRPWNDGDISEYIGTGTSQIVSDPPLSIEVGGTYDYDVNTVADFSDETEYSAVYSLARGPEGMKIDEETGRIVWMPIEPGVYNVAVKATIPELDESDQQVWRVTVVANVSGVNDPIDANFAAGIYPNPAKDGATLRFVSTGGERRIVLVDSRGAEVYSTAVNTTHGTNVVALDIDEQTPGAYTVIVRGGEGTTTLPLQLVR